MVPATGAAFFECDGCIAGASTETLSFPLSSSVCSGCGVRCVVLCFLSPVMSEGEDLQKPGFKPQLLQMSEGGQWEGRPGLRLHHCQSLLSVPPKRMPCSDFWLLLWTWFQPAFSKKHERGLLSLLGQSQRETMFSRGFLGGGFRFFLVAYWPRRACGLFQVLG